MAADLLHGLHVVVTGGGGGIGAALAQRCVAEGARVVVSDVDEAAADAVVQALDPTGGVAIAVRCDVTKAVDCAALVARAEAFFGGPLDVFLANAGASFAGDFLSADPAELRHVIEVNVIGSVLSAQAALRSLVQRPRSSLIFTSSVSGVTARARRSAYNASKHALTGLVKSLALEFGPAGVRVNAVAPGPTNTPFLRAHLAKVEADPDAAIARLAASLPTGCLIEPEDVADAVVYLASPAGRAVTGHTLVIDGGSSAGRM